MFIEGRDFVLSSSEGGPRVQFLVRNDLTRRSGSEILIERNSSRAHSASRILLRAFCPINHVSRQLCLEGVIRVNRVRNRVVVLNRLLS